MSGPRSRFALAPLANQYPVLHGLRVVAIVAVLQHHVTDVFGTYNLLADDNVFARFSWSLWFGMDVFFLLSGFLIGTMLLASETHAAGIVNAVPGAKPRPVSLRRFYLRRMFRIMPLYYVWLTFYAFLVLPLATGGALPSAEQWRHLWYEYVYLTNYSPIPWTTVMPWGWSLAVEEHFYLVVPLLVTALRFVRSQPRRIALLGALWASGTVVRLAVYARSGPWSATRMIEWFYIRSHLRYDILVAGVLLAYVQQAYGARIRVAIRESGAAKKFFAAAALPWFLLIAQSPEALAAFPRLKLFYWGTITSLAFVPTILWLLNSDGIVQRFLGARAFLPIATLGYGIYLVHVPVVYVLAAIAKKAVSAGQISLGAAWLLTLAGLLAVSGCFSYVLHIAVERPALRLRDRLAG